MKVEDIRVKYFPDRRLMVLLPFKLDDINVRFDPTNREGTICLHEDTIFLLFETYLALNNYNNWKLRKKYGLS